METALQLSSPSVPLVRDKGILKVGEGDSGSGRDSSEATLGKEIPSWASKAMDKRVLNKYDVEIVSIDGKNKVEIPDAILKESTPLWEEFVVGKFLDLAPHIAKVHMVVNKIWKYGDSSSKVEVYGVDDKTMRFKIANVKAREKIIKRGMWNIAGVPMVVKKWTPKAEEKTPEEEAIPMWVHLRNIPLHTFSWEALSFMTSVVGFPIRLHQDTIACSDFEEAKVFVKVDVTKKLPKEIDFTLGGVEFTPEFYYPWLPARCVKCEKWGHKEETCVMKKRGLRAGGEKTEATSNEKDVKQCESNVVVKKGGAKEDIKEDNVPPPEVQMVEMGTEGKKGDNWSNVALDKIGRAHTPVREKDEILISASKYFVLSVAEGDDEENTETNELVEDVEEKDEAGEVDLCEDLESDTIEDEILNQKSKEKDKQMSQKGYKRIQKPKTLEVQPRSKRSSRRKL